MKTILITGKNSYIGNSIQRWLENNFPNEYIVSQLDVIGEEWKEYDFRNVDSIIHVAGIVHQPKLKDWSIYEKVNVHLPLELATIAKAQGVSQFIFLSSMAVFGVEKQLVPTVIDVNTIPSPKSMYGKSKLLAEQELQKLENSSFSVCIVRPPNVYGKGCKGNYIPGFLKLVRLLPAIPVAYETVKQSMLYIDHLCEFVRLAIERNIRGFYHPQDRESICAICLMQSLANAHCLSRPSSYVLGKIVMLFSFLPLIKKIYGGVEYNHNCDVVSENSYNSKSFNENIEAIFK